MSINTVLVNNSTEVGVTYGSTSRISSIDRKFFFFILNYIFQPF